MLSIWKTLDLADATFANRDPPRSPLWTSSVCR